MKVLTLENILCGTGKHIKGKRVKKLMDLTKVFLETPPSVTGHYREKE